MRAANAADVDDEREADAAPIEDAAMEAFDFLPPDLLPLPDRETLVKHGIPRDMNARKQRHTNSVSCYP